MTMRPCLLHRYQTCEELRPSCLLSGCQTWGQRQGCRQLGRNQVRLLDGQRPGAGAAGTSSSTPPGQAPGVWVVVTVI